MRFIILAMVLLSCHHAPTNYSRVSQEIEVSSGVFIVQFAATSSRQNNEAMKTKRANVVCSDYDGWDIIGFSSESDRQLYMITGHGIPLSSENITLTYKIRCTGKYRPESDDEDYDD